MYDHAFKLLEYAFKIFNDPNSRGLMCNNLGNIYLDLEKTDEAIKAYKEAAMENPKCAIAYFNIGNCKRREGNLDESLKFF
jgi:tetratricopeptide (TPR) repeat protein